MSTNQILAASANWPELDLASQIEGKTYLVTTPKVLSNTTTLAKNITLVFAGGMYEKEGDSLIPKGGMITGSGTLIGNNTKIIAPIQQIFDINLNIKGLWIMDRAYPQWFGAQNDYNREAFDAKKDASKAINKAIELKQTGEVFIPRGEYLVLNSIKVKIGIILKGEKSHTYVDSSANLKPPMFTHQGTILRPYQTGNYTGGFFVRVNVADSTTETGEWEVAFAEFRTEISDIYFCNHEASLKNIRGVLFGGAINIEFCRWKGFAQAVASVQGSYSDSKSIKYCHFASEYIKHNVSKRYYAFDLSGMGDALTFKYNHILKTSLLDDDKTYIGGLKLYQNLGAEISDNILNADVKMTNCKGIVFSNNHCEGNRTQLQITRSTVRVSDNFFEKGAIPSMRIEDENNSLSCDTSVVSLDNNVFAYYENDTKTMSSYDIEMDARCLLSVDKSYRYWVRRNSIHRKFPYGLAICNLSGNPVDNFNKHSYYLSNNGLMTLGYCVVHNQAVKTQNTLGITSELSDYVLWKKGSGVAYTYSAQFVWDSKRLIVSSVFPCASSVTPNSSNGVKLTLSGLDPIGFQAPIRLFRKNITTNITEWVDLPVCGHKYLYDNGESICGFKWSSLNVPSQTGLTPTGAVEFVGDNVKMNCTSIPTYGSWANGDIIFNIGSGTNALWIRQGTNSWSAK